VQLLMSTGICRDLSRRSVTNVRGECSWRMFVANVCGECLWRTFVANVRGDRGLI